MSLAAARGVDVGEDEPLMGSEGGAGEIGVGNKQMGVESFVLGTSWSVLVQHSKLYVALSVLQLLVCTAALVWVTLDHSAIHSGGFIFLEIVMILSLAFDTMLQMHLQGPRRYFLGPKQDLATKDHVNPQGDIMAYRTDNEEIVQTFSQSCSVLWRQYSFIPINYGQLLILIFSIVGLATSLNANHFDWEEDVAFSLLLVRYFCLLLFFMMNYCRTTSAQGGTLKACCGGEEDVDEDWDVKF